MFKWLVRGLLCKPTVYKVNESQSQEALEGKSI